MHSRRSSKQPPVLTKSGSRKESSGEGSWDWVPAIPVRASACVVAVGLIMLLLPTLWALTLPNAPANADESSASVDASVRGGLGMSQEGSLTPAGNEQAASQAGGEMEEGEGTGMPEEGGGSSGSGDGDASEGTDAGERQSDPQFKGVVSRISVLPKSAKEGQELLKSGGESKAETPARNAHHGAAAEKEGSSDASTADGNRDSAGTDGVDGSGEKRREEESLGGEAEAEAKDGQGQGRTRGAGNKVTSGASETGEREGEERKGRSDKKRKERGKPDKEKSEKETEGSLKTDQPDGELQTDGGGAPQGSEAKSVEGDQGKDSEASSKSGSEEAAVQDGTPEGKMKEYMKMINNLIPEIRTIKEWAVERRNTQLKNHAGNLLDRAEELSRAWRRKGAKGGWAGEERTMGVIKLMELMRARGQEWHNTVQRMEQYQKQAEKMKEKMADIIRERNGLDLAMTKALPKSLMCFNLRLSQAWSESPGLKEAWESRAEKDAAKFVDPKLHHYALFSDNVLAAAVVVNSTAQNLKRPKRHVIHLVTEALNIPAMKGWFALHPPPLALEIRDIASFTFLNASYCPVLKQLQASAMKAFYFSQRDGTTGGARKNKDPDLEGGSGTQVSGSGQLKFKNPKYLSMLNHLRFYLPEMYPTLDRVVFLDDDIVVQRDLTPLFKLPMHGNVNGAVFTCTNHTLFHRLRHYLNFSNPFITSNFDPDSCGWAYGMNVFDLKAWREKGLTDVYHKYQTMNKDRTLWKLGTLPPGLMTFYGLTEPLDRSWHVLGLGYNEGTSLENALDAAVVHYNGNWKPWLDTALGKFKGLWTKYVPADDDIIQQCNIDLS